MAGAFTSGCWIELRGIDGSQDLGNVRIELIDAIGRRIVTFTAGEGRDGVGGHGILRAGSRIFWDGRMEDGSPAPPGLYLARLAGSAGASSAKLIRVP
jgi:hypothetical protein